ncbi:MAG: acyl-CoA dehydrogenase [Actinomyces sp.]|nr:MAG: acyl-CoA dehydrogenase [Actinomyces sp.]
MSDYRVPLDDITFSLHHVADLARLATLPGYEHTEPDLVEGLLSEAARFTEEVIAPTNRTGDTVGSVRNDDGTVTTPPGFKEAYQRYVEAGWGGVPFDPAYEGGGFPWLLGLALQEMLTSANMAFSLCPLLTQGAIDLLSHHGSEEQKELYLRKMVTGQWTGTMNLTEPQAGSDVGALTTRAVPAPDGTYRITGTKIFITYGEHDLAENIIHLVLARTPDAPPGTRGISCFIVPKYLPDADGNPGERNDVRCVSLEHKLGIHASPTCVMAYGDEGGAVGYLIGEENAGMRYMFTMMNNARLSVGLEGLAIAERAYQQARAYAHERRQGRAPGAPAGESSPIVEHPDVQRMLLDMKSCIDAMRGLAYRNAEALDLASHGRDDAERQAGAERAALLTPLTKAWCTDLGVELTSTAIQVHGGMGYVEETGVAQHFRDARIAPIYEGTNGIQAIDLVMRKLPMRGGAVVAEHLEAIAGVADALADDTDLAPVHETLRAAHAATAEATAWLAEHAGEPRDVLAGATRYLEMLATTTGGAILAEAALAARKHADEAVAADKAVLARFFATQRLARVPSLVASVTAGADDLGAAASSILAG